jgi:hypothetical protein
MSRRSPGFPRDLGLAAAHQLRADLQNRLRDARSASYEMQPVLGEESSAYMTQVRFVAELEARLAALDHQVADGSELHRGQVRIKMSAREQFDLDIVFESDASAPLPVAVERTTRWLQIAELFVSPRIAREEIGDLLEAIHRYEREGRPAWHLYVRAITGAILAVWHTWGDKLASLRKIGG